MALAAPPWPVDLAGDARAQRRALYRLGAELYRDLVLLRAADSGDTVRGAAAARARRRLAPARVSAQGRDVTALGIAAGPEIGRLLAAVEAWWEAGDFRADRDAALAELKQRAGKR